MKALHLLLPLILLAGCDDRLDGEYQPNPFAEDDAASPVAAAPVPAPTAPPPDMVEETEEDGGNEEPIMIDGDEPQFDDGPYDPSGFDPAPIDDTSGFDPEPLDPGDGGFAD